MNLPAPREIRIRIAPELYLAAQEFGDRASCARGETVLALHGWMDNGATHLFTAPALEALGFHVVVLDLPGHGKSDHLPPSAYYTIFEHAAHLMEAAAELKLQRFVLIGHSMGAGVAAFVAGAYPSRVAGVILIENLGPSSRLATDAPSLFVRAVEGKRTAATVEVSTYASSDDAVAARLATVARYEGNQTLSLEGATALVARALVPAGPLRWRFGHDRRIASQSLFSATEEVVCEFLRAIAAPTLLIRGDRGWPVRADVLQHRLALVQSVVTFRELPGSHHLHLDPSTAGAVTAAMGEWVRAVDARAGWAATGGGSASVG